MFPGILDFDPQFVNFGVSSLTAASGKVCRKGLGSERCGLWKRMSVNLLERRVWGRGFEEGGCLKFGREKSTCLLGANLGVQRGWQRRRITANSPVPSSWGMSRTGLKRSIHLAIAKGKGMVQRRAVLCGLSAEVAVYLNCFIIFYLHLCVVWHNTSRIILTAVLSCWFCMEICMVYCVSVDVLSLN